MKKRHESTEFAEVLMDELRAVVARRNLNGMGGGNCADVDKQKHEFQDAHELGGLQDHEEVLNREETEKLSDEHVARREALDQETVGICFSGGGIRSATFNLGILHALSDLGLLTRFDYLSTVSGGGYIGSWLSAWIKREGNAQNVERQLQVSRNRQAMAKRGRTPIGEVFDADPEPVCHLRAYGNYLTPQLGIFSVDAWVLVSIYFRNLLLNLLVLVPFLLALIMTERMLILVFIKTTDVVKTSAWEQAVWFTGLTLMCLMVLPILLWINRSMQQIKDGLQGNQKSKVYRLERRDLHRYVLIPSLIISVLATWLAFGHTKISATTIDDDFPILFYLSNHCPWIFSSWFPHIATGAAMAFVTGSFQILSAFDHRLDEKNPHFLQPLGSWLARFGLGVLTGFFGGVLLYHLFHAFHSQDQPTDHAALLSLSIGPPVFLLALNLIAWLQVGLISRLWSESIREWWASLTGSSLIYIAGWILLFGLSIWGPWAVLRLDQDINWIDKALLAGWGSTVGGGLLAIRSAPNRSETGGKVQRVLAKLVPYVFLIGLIILTSFVADYFMLPVGPAESPDAYLRSVENQNAYFPFMPVVVLVLFAFTAFASSRIDVNSFGLHALYKNRLVRCYLGASRRKASDSDGPSAIPGAPTNVMEQRPRSPNPLTGFDPRDDLKLSGLSAHCGDDAHRRRTRLENQLNELQATAAAAPAAKSISDWIAKKQIQWKIYLLENSLRSHVNEPDYTGPFHIICGALNLVHGGELAWQERKAESFAMTPLYCGSSATGYVRSDDYSGGISIGDAVSISGAAVSPNMGYHSTGPMTALLAIFNMRLGAWKGNPRSSHWTSPGPKNLLKYFSNELFGLTNAGEDYVYLSDGGHFENLGLYELLRRRCRFIVVCDSGADPNFNFQDLGGVIRKARIDFGIPIQIDVEQLKSEGEKPNSEIHFAVGRIQYGQVDDRCDLDSGELGIRKKLLRADLDELPKEIDSDDGILIYIKPTITGDEPQDVLNYRTGSPSFPHEPTTDQWFSESQFESYRALGWHIGRQVFDSAVTRLPDGTLPQDEMRKIFHDLYQRHCSDGAQTNS